MCTFPIYEFDEVDHMFLIAFDPERQWCSISVYKYLITNKEESKVHPILKGLFSAIKKYVVPEDGGFPNKLQILLERYHIALNKFWNSAMEQEYKN